MSKPSEDEAEAKPQMTEEEKYANREKSMLYLRHRLQKGFLSRDEQPKESEMALMADFFTQLEQHTDIEPSIIRQTKIHKVLKAIVKLSSIPREEEFNFKKRSAAMLEIWNKRMEGDAEPSSAVDTKPTPLASEPPKDVPATNGDVKEEAAAPQENGTAAEVETKPEETADKLESKVEASVPAVVEKAAEPVQSTAPTEAGAEKVDGIATTTDSKDAQGDVNMENTGEAAAATAS